MMKLNTKRGSSGGEESSVDGGSFGRLKKVSGRKPNKS
jgi:hypothetical protein